MANATAEQDIARKWMAHYINTKMTTDNADSYILLGDDLEEFIPEMSTKVDKKNNILGSSVEPYYAKKGDKLFDRLQNILDNALTLDDVSTDVVEVKLWENEVGEGVYPSVREKAIFEVTSYGGDTTAYQIPFTLHYTGERSHGTFDILTKTFTATT